MKKNEIKDILSGLDRTKMPDREKILSYCKDAVPERQPKRRGFSKRSAIILAAAIISLFAIVGCAAEVKEYNDAVDFFEENSLSIENLSRSEIKKIYRDITTKRFAYDKTAQVLGNTVLGYQITGDEPTPKELEEVWNKLGKTGHGIEYSWYYLDNEIFDEERELTIGGEMMFYKSVDGEMVWETKIPLRDSYVEGYSLLDGGRYIAVYGVDGCPYSRTVKHTGFVELFDDATGESKWRYTFTGYEFFGITDVLECGDEMVVFGRGDLENFVFTRLDLTGKMTYQKITEIGNLGIWDVAYFGDGYLVQLGGYQVGEKLVKVSDKGEISDSISYTSKDTAYFIEDMIEYGGKVYLSTYAVPKRGGEIQKGHDEISWVFDLIYEQGELKTSEESCNINGKILPTYGVDSKALTERIRENYTAVLLVCDGETVVPDVFYSVDGSVCSELYISDKGEMVWETQYISDTYYSPATSAFSIGGACYVYKHTFGENGNLISSERTGEVCSFMR